MINITKAITIKQEIHEKTDNTKSDITKAALRIIGISPITDDNFECLDTPNTSINDLYARKAVDFLTKEMKYTQEECRKLDILRITRPRTHNTDRLYIHFATEKSADFLQRKAITINTMFASTERQKINTKPFIPPQLHARFADLSKHCYDRRKETLKHT